MAIRMSGMVSGLDTEGIIQSLMEVQTKKKTKVENNKTKLEWKQEKWNDLNNKIYKLYTGTLSNMRLSSSFNAKKASSTDESKVKVSACTDKAVKLTWTKATGANYYRVFIKKNGKWYRCKNRI